MCKEVDRIETRRLREVYGYSTEKDGQSLANSEDATMVEDATASRKASFSYDEALSHGGESDDTLQRLTAVGAMLEFVTVANEESSNGTSSEAHNEAFSHKESTQSDLFHQVSGPVVPEIAESNQTYEMEAHPGLGVEMVELEAKLASSYLDHTEIVEPGPVTEIHETVEVKGNMAHGIVLLALEFDDTWAAPLRALVENQETVKTEDIVMCRTESSPLDEGKMEDLPTTPGFGDSKAVDPLGVAGTPNAADAYDTTEYETQPPPIDRGRWNALDLSVTVFDPEDTEAAKPIEFVHHYEKLEPNKSVECAYMTSPLLKDGKKQVIRLSVTALGHEDAKNDAERVAQNDEQQDVEYGADLKPKDEADRGVNYDAARDANYDADVDTADSAAESMHSEPFGQDENLTDEAASSSLSTSGAAAGEATHSASEASDLGEEIVNTPRSESPPLKVGSLYEDVPPQVVTGNPAPLEAKSVAPDPAFESAEAAQRAAAIAAEALLELSLSNFVEDSPLSLLPALKGLVDHAVENLSSDPAPEVANPVPHREVLPALVTDNHKEFPRSIRSPVAACLSQSLDAWEPQHMSYAGALRAEVPEAPESRIMQSGRRVWKRL